MNRREFLSTLTAAICAPSATVAPVIPTGDVAIPYAFWTKGCNSLVLPADFLLTALGIELPPETTYTQAKHFLDECWVEFRLNKRPYFEGSLAVCYGRTEMHTPMLARAGSEIELFTSMPGPFFVMHGMLRVA